MGYSGGAPPVSFLVGIESESFLQAKSVLTRVGFEVHAVSSGQEALEVSGRRHTDLLVLVPPLSDGSTCLDSAKAITGQHPDVTVLVIGEKEPSTRREYEELGAWLFETPLNMHLLSNCAKSLMRQMLFQARVLELEDEVRGFVQVDDSWFRVFDLLRRGKR